MSDTTKKLSLWAKLAGLVARLGGVIASSVMTGKNSEKAAEISGKVGDVNDAVSAALDETSNNG